MEQKASSIWAWKGRPMETLKREELLEAVEYLCQENLALREDRDRWRQSGNAIKYMLNRNTNQPPKE